MNCDTLKEGRPVLCRVVQVNTDSLFLDYELEKPESFFDEVLQFFMKKQFGVVHPADTFDFKKGDTVLVSIHVDKVKK